MLENYTTDISIHVIPNRLNRACKQNTEQMETYLLIFNHGTVLENFYTFLFKKYFNWVLDLGTKEHMLSNRGDSLLPMISYQATESSKRKPKNWHLLEILQFSPGEIHRQLWLEHPQPQTLCKWNTQGRPYVLGRKVVTGYSQPHRSNVYTLLHLHRIIPFVLFTHCLE